MGGTAQPAYYQSIYANAFDMCVALDIFLLHKNSIYSALRNENCTFHHLRWSPSLRAEARKEDRLRTTAIIFTNHKNKKQMVFLPLLSQRGRNHRNLIYNRNAIPKLATCHFQFATCIINAQRSLILHFAF